MLFDAHMAFEFQDSSILPVVRLILAQEEKERAYNLQGKSFRQLLLKVLQISNESADGIKIIQCSEDSLPNLAFNVMKTRTTEDSSLSVFKVDSTLTLLSEDYQKSAQETQLKYLIQNGNALDMKWLVKMILKKRMDIGISMTRVLDLLHPLAGKLFKKYLHLTRVVELIESGEAEKSLVDVCEVFVPLRAMLSQKFNAELKKENLSFSEMFAETKMDGERFQLHMKDNQFRFFSRNLFEFSEGFNELISPLIKFKTVVHSIILDGEMMVYE